MGPVVSRKESVPTEVLELTDFQITKLPSVLDLCFNLRSLNISGNYIRDLPRGITKLTNLTSLNWSFNGLETIPLRVFKLKNLKRLNLKGNKLHHLSNNLNQLTNLVSLDLSENQLTSIPIQLKSLKSLQIISLYRNKIKTLNEDFLFSKEIPLHELILGSNRLRKLPDTFTQLQDLEILFLSYNEFTIFPESAFRSLKKLTSLSFSSNSLEKITDCISNLSNLKKLDLRTNMINEISNKISHLTKLTTLDLSRNYLDKLPPDFCKLISLVELNLSDNNFKHIPHAISGLASLKQLNFCKNKIRQIDCSFKNLKNLFELNLSENALNNLQENIFCGLKSLGVLNLQRNSIKEIPNSISQLFNLLILNLSLNKINQLPQEFKSLINLIDLDLSYNKFQNFPYLLTKLENLAKLKLTGNQIEQIQKKLSGLKSLLLLDLSMNRFEFFPKGICSVSNLQSLYLGGNKLRLIPSCLILLNKLKELDLSSNNIFIISDAIGFMKSLNILNLSDNNIKKLPDSFFQIGASKTKKELHLDLSSNLLTKVNSKWLKLYYCKKLDLSNNHINQFPHNCFLKFLQLEKLNLSNNNARELDLGYLKRNEKLKFLHIEGNYCSKSFIKLLSTIKKSPRLYNLPKKNIDLQTLGIMEDNNLFNQNTIETNILNLPKNDFDSIEELLVNHEVKNPVCRQINSQRGRFKVGYSETQGKRPTMEDAIDIKMNFICRENINFFAIYDGHGGRETSNLAANEISSMFGKELEKLYSKKFQNLTYNNSIDSTTKTKPNSETKTPNQPRKKNAINFSKEFSTISSMGSNYSTYNSNDLKSSSQFNMENQNVTLTSTDGFTRSNSSQQRQNLTNSSQQSELNLDNNEELQKKKLNFQEHTNINRENQSIFYIFKKVFQKFNNKLIKKNEISGSTAIIILIVGNRIFSGNIGDSRSVLCRNNNPIRMSVDHKPYLPQERERITKSGGVVTEDLRINSGLAVSRAFGDLHYQPYVSSCPFVSRFRIQKNDRYIILACDGVWDVMSDQQAIKIVLETKDPIKAAIRIKNYAMYLGSSDNISVIVIDLQPELTKNEIAIDNKNKNKQLLLEKKLLKQEVSSDKNEFLKILKLIKLKNKRKNNENANKLKSSHSNTIQSSKNKKILKKKLQKKKIIPKKKIFKTTNNVNNIIDVNDKTRIKHLKNLNSSKYHKKDHFHNKKNNINSMNLSQNRKSEKEKNTNPLGKERVMPKNKNKFQQNNRGLPSYNNELNMNHNNNNNNNINGGNINIDNNIDINKKNVNDPKQLYVFQEVDDDDDNIFEKNHIFHSEQMLSKNQQNGFFSNKINSSKLETTPQRINFSKKFINTQQDKL
ncbi:leucine rich repeat containing protein [Anaeramoeba flamelloides]|uniref:Leucine rich repeat containing protein n=1 Tax=Anaeramoeba flamelloides TaxID=1746091 RepID=A0ABQ8Y840_9EUKA|nr:leucine rich repeat containing protein [Anaeramoeba flamelloides]